MRVKVVNVIDSKTCKVIATTKKKHSQYGKYITSYKKYLVDLAGKTVAVGDEVEISSSKPLSKNKKWALI